MKERIARLHAAVGALSAWYEETERPLPWRTEATPYRVWLSEIMLQQTRIEAVIPYFERFTAALPDIRALSEVDDERLMKLWEGLGYYSRARNLKKAAIAVMEKHGGQLPATAEELRRLPGIGPYTAGAIASIAFGQSEPAVDGNVLRVLSRILADGEDVMLPATRRRAEEELRAVYPAPGPACRTLTQALMELGQRVCIPNGTPDCVHCPARALCLAHAAGEEERYPTRSAKKPRRVEEKTVLLLFCGDRFALRRRPNTGLLAGLWEFPSLSGHLDESAVRAHLHTVGIEAGLVAPTAPAKHIFTHIEWQMTGYTVDCPTAGHDETLCWVTAGEWEENYATPTAYRAFGEIMKQRG